MRLHFLKRLAELKPKVLETLAAVDEPDDHLVTDPGRLLAWARGLNLVSVCAPKERHRPWILFYVEDTLELWRMCPTLRGTIWSGNRFGCQRRTGP
ncbi:MAG: hypothetical protein ABW292_14375 [Vicinamibacterales bacterium]